MKKHLKSILLAGVTAASAYAGPRELYNSLPKDQEYLEFKTENEYSVRAKAKKTKHRKRIREDLELEIKDSETKVTLVDINSNNLSKDDTFKLEHIFKNGDKFILDFLYVEDNRYKITSYFETEENGEKTIYGYDPIDTSKWWMKVLDIFGYVTKQVTPIVNVSKETFNGIVTSAEKGTEFDIPYKEVKESVLTLESKLDDIKTGKIKVRQATAEVNQSFLKLMTERQKTRNNVTTFKKQ